MTSATSRIRRIGTSALAALTIATVAAADGLIASEGFNYGGTPNLQGANGGTGWSSPWSKLSQIPTGAIPEGMNWPDLPTTGGSAYTAGYSSADYTRYSRVIGAYTAPNDEIYISFLLRPNLGYGVGGGLAFGTWENGIVVGIATGTGHYGLAGLQGPAVPSSTPLVQNQSALLVVRVVKNADATITWSLHVNPSVGPLEPAGFDATLTIPGTSLPQALMIYNDGGFSTDEIRVATTWSAALGLPEPACAADLDGDGMVDGSDLGELLGQWGDAGSGDLNGDGVVDGDDLGSLLGGWGACP